ncbi:hypothetical protein FRC12_005453 [Ceratobasidium sp. 428]|nr:hypothetical protein FRC12_005453 [Ceratobasidium sp. 428]
MASFELLLDISILILALAFLCFRLRSCGRQLPLPPSPNSDPIIGHLRVLPTSNEHLVYARLSDELHSDIVSLTVLGKTIIILNSAEAAHDLLDRRSAIYSDRSELPMISDPKLVDWSRITGLLRYGERWRSQRRMTHASLHKTASVQFWPLIVKQSRLALHRLLTNPDNFFKEFRRMSGATLLSAVYGYEVTSAHDPLVEVVENALNHMCEAAVPGNFFVNIMPWLRFFPNWFPGTTWKQTVKEWRAERDEMVDVPFDWTKNQMANGATSSSVLRTLLSSLENNRDQIDSYEDEEDRIKWTVGTLFGGKFIELHICANRVYTR